MNNVGRTDEVSKNMLERFDEIATVENVESMNVLGGQSIQVVCKCGCTHVHHILGVSPNQNKHHEIHYIELCSKHEID